MLTAGKTVALPFSCWNPSAQGTNAEHCGLAACRQPSGAAQRGAARSWPAPQPSSPNHVWKQGARQTESTPGSGAGTQPAGVIMRSGDPAGSPRCPHPVRLAPATAAPSAAPHPLMRRGSLAHLDRTACKPPPRWSAGLGLGASRERAAGRMRAPAASRQGAAAAAQRRRGAPGSCSSSGGRPSLRRYRLPRSAVAVPACDEPAGDLQSWRGEGRGGGNCCTRRGHAQRPLTQPCKQQGGVDRRCRGVQGPGVQGQRRLHGRHLTPHLDLGF